MIPLYHEFWSLGVGSIWVCVMELFLIVFFLVRGIEPGVHAVSSPALSQSKCCGRIWHLEENSWKVRPKAEWAMNIDSRPSIFCNFHRDKWELPIIRFQNGINLSNNLEKTSILPLLFHYKIWSWEINLYII